MTEHQTACPVEQNSAINPRCLIFVSRYCATCWRNARIPADSWGDATQELIRLLLEERLKNDPQAWADMVDNADGSERRELVRAIDRIKKRYQRSRKHGQIDQNGHADVVGHVERERATLWEHVEHLMQGLSLFQCDILRLSRDGWAVGEIAVELHAKPERVSDEKYKAICKLRGLVGSIA